MVAFIAAVVLILYAWSRVMDLVTHERDITISEQAMPRTILVFWVVFCAFSIVAVVQMLQVPMFSRQPPGQHILTLLSPSMMSFVQLGLLLPDDLPVRCFQDLSCTELCGMGLR
ncbi:MAG: DUF2178 domain-containing protein [Methanomicrobiales archaeon]